MANIAYNMLRYVFHEGRRVAASRRPPHKGRESRNQEFNITIEADRLVNAGTRGNSRCPIAHRPILHPMLFGPRHVCGRRSGGSKGPRSSQINRHRPLRGHACSTSRWSCPLNDNTGLQARAKPAADGLRLPIVTGNVGTTGSNCIKCLEIFHVSPITMQVKVFHQPGCTRGKAVRPESRRARCCRSSR